MNLLGMIHGAWRRPAAIWPILRRHFGWITIFHLKLRARWNGTQIEVIGSICQEHPVSMQGAGLVSIGDGVQLGSVLAGSLNNPILLQPRSINSKIVLANGVKIMNGCELISLSEIYIGKNCLIGPKCCFMDSDFHNIDPKRRLEEGLTAPIYIDDNVWLGTGVLVLKGVTIGKSSIVAAGSVVTKDVQPFSIVAGNPAKFVRLINA